MAEPQKRMAGNKALKMSMIGGSIVIALILLGRITDIIPRAEDFSATGAIAFCTILSIVLIGSFGWYLKRTDEHDLHANLWSMAWAWVATAVVSLNWSILHVASIAPAPDAIIILMCSTAVAGAIWAWLRFR